MQLKLIQMLTSGPLQIDFSGDPTELDSQTSYWLSIKADDRNDLVTMLEKFEIENRILKLILDPMQSSRFTIFSDTVLANLTISSASNMYQSQYLSVLIKNNLLISILPEDNGLFSRLEQNIRSNAISETISLYHLVYYMVSEILHQGLDNLSKARKRINDLSMKLDEGSNQIPSSDITYCKREMSQLADIYEDQNSVLGFFPKLDWSEKASPIRNELVELIHGFGHLFNSAERLEEKLTSIQIQYQMMLQEKGNKRLSTLTIVQSIFVPLTFIAGIYGMNFVFMPELENQYAYFVVLGSMFVLAIGILLWFKRKGWFD